MPTPQLGPAGVWEEASLGACASQIRYLVRQPDLASHSLAKACCRYSGPTGIPAGPARKGPFCQPSDR